MRHLLKKVTNLEKRAGIGAGYTNIHLIIYDNSFVSNGYFTDERDQKEYYDWRLQNIKKEMERDSIPYRTYILTEQDTQEHINAFRKEQEVMIKLAEDYEEDYRRELCMPLPLPPVLTQKTLRLV